MTDAVQTEKDRLLQAFRNLESRVTEQALMQDAATLATEIANLPNRLQAIRQRGYVYAADLEAAIAGMAKQSQDAQDDARDRAQPRSQRLGWGKCGIQRIISPLSTLYAGA